MVSALDSGSRGPGLIPGQELLCVVGQDTSLLSQYLSLPRCINGYREFNAGWHPCDGLPSHTGRFGIILFSTC